MNRTSSSVSPCLAIMVVAASIAVPGFAAEPSSPLEFPRIAGYGGVVRLPDAGERPRAGGQVVFDTTAAAVAGKPSRGLDSAARLVNVYVSEGMEQSRPRIAVILHTGATPAALSDDAHGRSAAGGPNPNRQLVEALVAEGVEVWVCGQSVIRGGHTLDDVLPGIKVAYSAMIFNINRQADGWSTLGVH